MKSKTLIFLSPQFLVNRFLIALLFITTLVFFTSCSNETVSIDQSDTLEGNIVEVLKTFDSGAEVVSKKSNQKGDYGNNKPSFKTLTVALAKTGLAGIYSSNQLTAFAPTDAAFAKLGLNHQNINTVPNLSEILLYHVVAGKVFSSDLQNGFVPTINGAAVEINLDNGAMVDLANINLDYIDIEARNGVIHAIDAVLFPPMVNLKDLAISAFGMESSIVQAVLKAGLVDALESGGPFTVFIPTEEAFGDLIAELDGVNSLDDLDAATLEAVLKYHIVQGRVYSRDLMSGPVETLNGSFNIDVDMFKITDNNDRMAMLVADMLNIQATNGVVHIIDKVLLP